MERLILGDCVKEIQKLASGSVDLVVTDCPYKIVEGGCTNHAVKLSGAKKEDLSKGVVFSKNEVRFSEWLPEVYRILKEGSHCYVMINDRNMQELLNEATRVGFRVLNILVWKKNRHTPNRYYLKNCEFIVLFRKGKAKNINDMGSFAVMECDTVQNKMHPSEKPTSLMEIFVKNSSNEGDVVMDPFMGVCPVGVVCQKLNRDFIGIEIDEKYFNIAKERIGKIQIDMFKGEEIKNGYV